MKSIAAPIRTSGMTMDSPRSIGSPWRQNPSIAMRFAADIVFEPHLVAQTIDEPGLPIARVVLRVVHRHDERRSRAHGPAVGRAVEDVRAARETKRAGRSMAKAAKGAKSGGKRAA